MARDAALHPKGRDFVCVVVRNPTGDMDQGIVIDSKSSGRDRQINHRNLPIPL